VSAELRLAQNVLNGFFFAESCQNFLEFSLFVWRKLFIFAHVKLGTGKTVLALQQVEGEGIGLAVVVYLREFSAYACYEFVHLLFFSGYKLTYYF
jgi:hypothetical protein